MKGGGDDGRAEVLKPHVHLAVEALRALGEAVAPPAVTASSGRAASDRISPAGVSLSAMCVLADALAEQIADALTRAPRAPEPHPPNAARDRSVALEEFAERLERHVTARHSASTIATLPLAERIRRFIESHFADDLTLEDIAEAIGCARSLVAATVKHQLGVTTHRYLTRMRIRRAAELIARGEKIEGVMLSVGYRSKRNFYRQFKLETGHTPAVYRRVHPGRESTAVADPNPCSPSARAAIGWNRTAPSVTVSGASELLGVSRRTVYYWIKNGKLQTIRRLAGGQRILVDSSAVAKTR